MGEILENRQLKCYNICSIIMIIVGNIWLTILRYSLLNTMREDNRSMLPTMHYDMYFKFVQTKVARFMETDP